MLKMPLSGGDMMVIGQLVLKISDVKLNQGNDITLHNARQIDGVLSLKVDSGYNNISVTFNPAIISGDDIMNFLLDSGIVFKRYNIS